MTAVRACQILGLPNRTTWSDVRQAYLDLVKVWHPDRFESDQRLQARAAKRLAEINEAYEFLREVHRRHERVADPSPRTEPNPSPTPQPSNTESSSPPAPENALGQEVQAEPPSRAKLDADQVIRRVVLGAIVWLAVLIVLVVFLGTRRGDAPSSTADKHAPPARWLDASDLSTVQPKRDTATVVASTRPQLLSTDPGPGLSPLPATAPRPLSTDPNAGIQSAAPEVSPSRSATYAQTVLGVERPESGAELIVAAETGLGSLQVRGTTSDAVVILYRGDVQHRAAYIRASDTAVIPTIAAGIYNVHFTSGKWWNGEEFLKEATFSEFERPLVFAETQEKNGIAYSDFKLTLSRVIGGNARTRRTTPFKLSKQIPLEGR